jgi:hypothetical protein
MAAHLENHPHPSADLVAGGAQWNPVATAALVGGALAASAGAYFGTRAIARRNARIDGKPVNSVMANAITACDVAHKKAPFAMKEPPIKVEPKVVVEPRV